ncbi:MAG TPA: DinB family protein [Gemmatimonadales bacterium]|nr:DinB family protein [Gemmatimonadales bacterium]
MADLQTLLTDHRKAVTAFLAAARSVPLAEWAEPRAPGKWSPGQVTEHVANAYETNRGVLQGGLARPAAPRFLRPLIGLMLGWTVLKRGRFGSGSKSPKPFRPSASPASQEALTGRLQTVADRFEGDITAAAGRGQDAIQHPIFGKLRLTDFLRLDEIHTNHHRPQLSLP